LPCPGAIFETTVADGLSRTTRSIRSPASSGHPMIAVVQQ